MGIELKLDAGAVRALIADDEGFRLELQRCVVAEVVRKTLGKDLDEEGRKLVFGEVDEAICKLRKSTRKTLEDETLILERVRTEIARDLKLAVSEGELRARRGLGANLLRGIEQRVTQLVTEALEERSGEIQKSIEERIERVLSSMEETWKEEAAKQIRADVVSRLNGALT